VDREPARLVDLSDAKQAGCTVERVAAMGKVKD
jgi:hypothetical protein